MDSLYFNPITAVRDSSHLLHAFSPEMCLSEDDEWFCSFPARSDSIPGPGPVSVKNGIVQKRKSGVHANVNKGKRHPFRRWNG